MTTPTKEERAAMIDKLGQLEAKIADIEAQAKPIKERLKTTCQPGIYDGRLFRAVITQFERKVLDLDAVRARLPAAWLARHTKMVAVTALSIRART